MSVFIKCGTVLRPRSHYGENHDDGDGNVYGNGKKRGESVTLKNFVQLNMVSNLLQTSFSYFSGLLSSSETYAFRQVVAMASFSYSVFILRFCCMASCYGKIYIYICICDHPWERGVWVKFSKMRFLLFCNHYTFILQILCIWVVIAILVIKYSMLKSLPVNVRINKQVFRVKKLVGRRWGAPNSNYLLAWCPHLSCHLASL